MLLIGSGSSAKALRSELGLQIVSPIRTGAGVGTFKRWSGRGWIPLTAQGLNDNVIIWGAELPADHWLRRRCNVLNAQLTTNKLLQLELFYASGIPCPPWITRYVNNWAFGPNDNPMWLGRHVRHHAGRDITGPFTTAEMRDQLRRGLAHYGVQLIDKTHEWRVHIGPQEETLRIARKVWTGEGPIPDNPAWNIDSGWHFRYNIDLRDTTRRDITTLARDACRALRFDFGAVDIIATRRNGQYSYYVLEVNSAPGIADNRNTLLAYADAFRRWEQRIRTTTRR